MNGLRIRQDFIQYKQLHYLNPTNHRFNKSDRKSNLVVDIQGDGTLRSGFEVILFQYKLK